MVRTERSSILKRLAITLAVSLLSVFSATTNFQASAQETASDEEDPHTDYTGTMEITTTVEDGHVQTTYIFTSDQLRSKFGTSTVLRVEEHHISEGESIPSSQKEVHANKKLKLVSEDDGVKIDKLQKAKNDGIPFNTYEQWLVVEPISQDTSANANSDPILLFLQFIGILQPAEATHVQGWAHLSTAYSPYDPINLIWADTENASTDVLNAAVQRMNGNGWSQLTCYPSTTLYVVINGVYTGQHANEYMYTGGVCDQYHVRMWRINSNLAIGNGHQEVVDTNYRDIRHIGGLNTWEDHKQPGHRVTSWENGETQARNAFGLTGGTTCWLVWGNSHAMANSYTREYWNDARTTLISSAFSNANASIMNQVLC
jgi:hypothetical protein